MRMKWGLLKAVSSAVVLAGIGSLVHCATLDAVPEGVCGNAVVDPGEDCDLSASAPAHCAAPGKVGACHFDCRSASGDQGELSTCPAGYGCGVDDGVCRAPSGAFRVAYDGPPINAAKVTLGDLDGDGRLDVIAKGNPGFGQAVKTALYYFDESAGAPEVVDIPQPIASPIAAEVVSLGEGRPPVELVFGAVGVAALVGNAGRKLVPLAFPSLSQRSNERFVVAHADPTRMGAGATLSRPYYLRALSPDGSLGLSMEADGANGAPLGLAEKDPGKVLIVNGAPKRPAKLLGASKSICGDAAFAAGSDAVVMPLCQEVFDSAKPGIALPGSAPRRFATPDGSLITGMVSANFELGGSASILVSTSTGLYVAGAGEQFVALPGTSSITSSQAILAAFDDGASRYAAFSQVIVAFRGKLPDGGVGLQTELLNLKTSEVPWTRAVAVDFNGDGRTDIVASSEGQADISVFLNDGSTLNPSVLSTGGPVGKLEAGDFDGDAVGDLAFTRPALGGGEEIVIAYGQRSGASVQVSAGIPPPGASTAFSQVVNVGSDHASGIGDGIDDLALLAWNGSRTTVTSVIGSGNRLPSTPIVVVGSSRRDDQQQATLKQALAVGTLPVRTRDGKVDIVALGLTSGDAVTERLSTSVNRIALDLDSLIAGTARDVFPLPRDIDANRLEFVAIDLDGQGDETAIVVAGRVGGAPGAAFALPKDLKGATGNQTPLFEFGADVGLVAGGDLLATDFDGDGKNDLLLEVLVGEERRVLVSYGDGAKLGAPTPVPDNVGDSFVGIARVGVVPSQKDVVTCSKKRGVVRFTGTGRDRRVEPIAGFANDACEGVTGLAGGDVNGDGIDDLVLIRNGSVVVYLGGAK